MLEGLLPGRIHVPWWVEACSWEEYGKLQPGTPFKPLVHLLGCPGL